MIAFAVIRTAVIKPVISMHTYMFQSAGVVERLIQEQNNYNGAPLTFLVRGQDNGRYVNSLNKRNNIINRFHNSLKLALFILKYSNVFSIARHIWHYIEVQRDRLSHFKQQTRSGNIDVALFGTVLKVSYFAGYYHITVMCATRLHMYLH